MKTTGRPRKYVERQQCSKCGAPGELNRPKNGPVYFRPLCSTCRKLEVKLEVCAHYGNGEAMCVKCGYGNINALCIDHINGDGKKHRETLGRGRNYGGGIYYWLRAHNYPEGFQTLCFNCNQLKEVATRRSVEVVVRGCRTRVLN